MAKWVKGESGNPGGRTRGFERVARELIAAQRRVVNETGELDGWSALLLRLFAIAMGEVPDAKVREQIAAGKLLFERAHGYPRQDMKITESPAKASPGLSVEQRRELVETYERLGLLGTSGGPTEH